MGLLMRRHARRSPRRPWLAWLVCSGLLLGPMSVSRAAAQEEAAADDGEDSLEDARTILLQVDLGTGLSFREVEWPLSAGYGTLSLGPSATLDTALAMVYAPPGWFSLGLQMRYQTTVGATIDEQLVAGVARPMGVRGARFEAMLAPTAKLGQAFRLGLEVGYGVRGLRTHAHDQEPPTGFNLQTPDYTLGGPIARVSLSFVVGEVVTLTVSPELQAVLSVGDELTRRGASDGGLSLGGQACLSVALHPLLSVFVSYREAHATIGGQPGRADVSDVERFITAGLRGTP